MRNSLILGLILIGFLLGGFFSVDQRELGMVSFSANYSKLPTWFTLESSFLWRIELCLY